MINRLLFLVPEEAFLLLLMGAGIMMILGFRKTALQLAGGVILLALLGPFIDFFLDILPGWVIGLMLGGFLFSLFRLIFGGRVADNVISFLVYDLIRAPFRIIWFLLTRLGRRV